jgi:putative flippase GtrA
MTARILRFSAVGAAGIVVQLGLIAWLDRLTLWPSATVTALAVGVTVVHNFGWHWRWTWADRPLAWRDLPAALARFVGANGVVSIAGNLVLTTLLADAAGMPIVVANAMAIAACGLVNYVLADTFVFRSVTRFATPSADRPVTRARRGRRSREDPRRGAPP